MLFLNIYPIEKSSWMIQWAANRIELSHFTDISVVKSWPTSTLTERRQASKPRTAQVKMRILHLLDSGSMLSWLTSPFRIPERKVIVNCKTSWLVCSALMSLYIHLNWRETAIVVEVKLFFWRSIFKKSWVTPALTKWPETK